MADNAYKVKVQFDDGTEKEVGTLICPQGPQGPAGADGAQGPPGAAGPPGEIGYVQVYVVDGRLHIDTQEGAPASFSIVNGRLEVEYA